MSSEEPSPIEGTCRYCFRPAAALLQDIPLCAVHMASFVRHVGGPAELAGLSPAPVRQAADKHFRSDGSKPR